MLTKGHVSRTERAGNHFVRDVVGYRMTEFKCNEDIREELGIADVKTAIKSANINVDNIWKNV
jgi:hypothetical protein